MLFHDNAARCYRLCECYGTNSRSSFELRTFVFMKYATRLNSFASRPEKCWGKANYKPNALELIQRASQVNRPLRSRPQFSGIILPARLRKRLFPRRETSG